MGYVWGKEMEALEYGGCGVDGFVVELRDGWMEVDWGEISAKGEAIVGISHC